MSDPSIPLDLGPPPPIHIPPLNPVAGAAPPLPMAPAADGVPTPGPAPAPPAAPSPPPTTSPSKTTTPPATPTTSTYTIKAGDTLGDVAARNGTTVSEIMKANPQISNPNRISVGQEIKIPGKGGASSSGGTTTEPQRPSTSSPEKKPEPQAEAKPVEGLIFPFWIKPTASWKDGPRYFGCPRRGGRKHAGCDLYAPFGTPIRAIADGVVVRGPYYFYDGTNALEVHHPGVGVVRYGEISIAKKALVKGGDRVKAGQLIAYVGLLDSLQMHMLHFELFGESAKGQSLSGGGPFRRNPALKNPTPLIDKLYQKTFG